MRKCCVPGCRAVRLMSGCVGISYCRFPHPIKDRHFRYRKWLEVIGCDKLKEMDPMQVYMGRQICKNHFTDDLFVSNPPHGRIRRAAIPNKNLPTIVKRNHADSSDSDYQIDLCTTTAKKYVNKRANEGLLFTVSDYCSNPFSCVTSTSIRDTEESAVSEYCPSPVSRVTSTSVRDNEDSVADFQDVYVGDEVVIESAPTEISKPPQSMVIKSAPPTVTSGPPQSMINTYGLWSADETKMLINAYKIFRPKVGTCQIKYYKVMWERVADYLRINYDLPVDAKHCEIRWKKLERGYKMFMEKKDKTNEWVKIFEFEEEMNEVYDNKCLVFQQPYETSQDIPPSNQGADVLQTKTKTKNDVTLKRKNKRLMTRKMLFARHAYYKKRLAIEQDKLQQMTRRNDLLEERNNILRKRYADEQNPD